MAKKRNLPTEFELRILSPKEAVAYAARCAWRVQPIFELPNSENRRLSYYQAVDRAVKLALQTDGASREVGRAARATLIAAFDAARTAARQSKTDEIAAAADAAASAAFAAAARVAKAADVNSVAETAEFAVIAATSVGCKQRFIEAARHDFEHLQSMNKGMGEIHRFDASEDGPLGPLWPNGTNARYEKKREAMLAVLAEGGGEDKLLEQNVGQVDFLAPDLYSEKSTPNSARSARRTDSEQAKRELNAAAEQAIQNLEARAMEIETQKNEFEATVLESRTALEKSVNSTIESVKAEYEKLSKGVGALASKVSGLNDRIDGIGNDLDGLIEKASEDLEAVKQLAELEELTKRPRKYWEMRKANHLREFKRWVRYLVTYGAACLILISLALWLIPFYEESNDTVRLNFRSIGFTVLISSILLLGLRMIGRIVMSDLHLAIEADERIVMLQAYLSMAKSGFIAAEADRSLIMQAMFRPSTTGLVKEDAVPSSVLDLATRVAQGGKEKK